MRWVTFQSDFEASHNSVKSSQQEFFGFEKVVERRSKRIAVGNFWRTAWFVFEPWTSSAVPTTQAGFKVPLLIDLWTPAKSRWIPVHCQCFFQPTRLLDLCFGPKLSSGPRFGAKFSPVLSFSQQKRQLGAWDDFGGEQNSSHQAAPKAHWMTKMVLCLLNKSRCNMHESCACLTTRQLGDRGDDIKNWARSVLPF